MTSDESARVSDSARETAVGPPPEAGGVPSATARFTPGTLLAERYRVVAPLGKGGMGEVYRADDVRLGQPVALKFLPAAVASDPARLERLVDEVRIGRQISHPNVCRLYDIAEAQGHHFLVMEYVDGEDLASLLHRIGRLPGDKALEIARGLCAGLAVAHDRGVIHRDLKPANVMIDGQGHARIADFGLAALAGTGAASGFAGTPAYMAPEQLSGGGASLRSDVFALGLVLHEMLTGHRVFEGKSLDELRRLHAETRPKSLSSSVKDVDPALERLVLRCLSRDPADRPVSARAVLASLPGGDPLEAALLAGETPSPEMVAAAAKVGDLRPAAAWACLIAGLLGLLALPSLGGHVMLFRRVSLPKPPEALVDRAKDVLARLGYPDAPADSAFGFLQDSDLLDHAGRQDPGQARDTLSKIRPGPYLFYYRGSRSPLAATSWIPTPPWAGPAELGRVRSVDPPLDEEGMTRVVIDPHNGRLTRFAAVPQRFEPKPGPEPEPDWSVSLREAGFDPARLQPAAPRWAAPVDSDRKAAWEGALLDQPDVRFHVEAAAYRGRLVYFEMRGPWVEPPTAAGERTSLVAVTVFVIALACILGPVGVAFVRRNLRQRRADRKGASWLAAFAFVSLTLANLLRADHTSLPLLEIHLLTQIVSQGLFAALYVWLTYVAVEPSLRRRWPHALISWNRLLAGRLRDPLLGRDLTVGILAGVVAVLDFGLDAPLVLLGQPPLISTGSVVSTLTAPRHMAYFFLVSPAIGVAYSLFTLFALYLFQSLLRIAWLARIALFLVILAPSLTIREELFAAVLEGSVFAAIIVVVLVRFGLIASAMVWFTCFVLIRAPLTLDLSAWYAGRSLVVLGFFAALLAAAAYTSLGGKPLFGKALLDE